MMARFVPCLLLLAGVTLAQGGERDLPADIAAAHPDGKWKIRKRDLYIHLARYNSGHPEARIAFKDYLKQRIITREAAERNITVTEKEVDAWLEQLDRQVREASKGTMTLEQMMRDKEMSSSDMRRRARLVLLREGVVRSMIRERDRSWPANKPASPDAIEVAIDELFEKMPKEFDLAKLPKGALARIGDIEITEYEYGRQLVRALPGTEVGRALQDLLVAEEVALLLGNRNEPTAEELEMERRAFLIRERNRIARHPEAPKDPRQITAGMINQILAQRGLTIEKVVGNPGFKAQARARGYFMRQVSDDALKKFYAENKAKYGDRLRVRRILILSRAQPVLIAGKKVRNLDQGRAAAKAVHMRLEGGESFRKIAKKITDDPDFIRENDGLVPLWLSADAPGYQDTFAQADRLKEGEFSAPFFSAGRGFVIVKLIKRRRALGFAAQKKIIRRDAAEYQYRLWQGKAVRTSQRSRSLFN